MFLYSIGIKSFNASHGLSELYISNQSPVIFLTYCRFL